MDWRRKPWVPGAYTGMVCPLAYAHLTVGSSDGRKTGPNSSQPPVGPYVAHPLLTLSITDPAILNKAMPKVQLDRLYPKILIGDGCWEWVGTHAARGYGQLKVAGVRRLAHRVVYELLKGPIPHGLELDHLCHNRNCVRPNHLEPVTHQENMLRHYEWARQQAS